MKRIIGAITAGALLAAPVAGGIMPIAVAPAAAADRVVVQTVMDERAMMSTGKARVWAPGLENLEFDTRSNKTVVTKAGSSQVIASRNNPYPRKAFRLKPGTYRFKTTITYRTQTYSGTVSRTQSVKVLNPAAGTCIYMVKNGDELGKPGDEFMVWHKVGRSVHGIGGGFQSEYADLRLKFNTTRTKASGYIFLYPNGERRAKTFKVKGKSNKSYAAKGWYRVGNSTWKSQYPRKSTPHC